MDAEATGLKRKLDEIAASQKPSDGGLEKASEETTLATIEVGLVCVNWKIQLNRKLTHVKVIYHVESNFLCIKCILDPVLSSFLDADINNFSGKQIPHVWLSHVCGRL
jgi:hypothetical protein